MGLEMMELVMACEEEFGVVIDEDTIDVAEIETAGGLAAAIAFLVEFPRVRGCPRVPVFFSLRHALATQLPLEGIEVGAKTPLSDLFPRRGRRKAWRALARALPYRLPSLETPVPTKAIGWAAACLGIPLTFWLVAQAYVVLENTAFYLLPVLLFAIPMTLFLLSVYLMSSILPAQTLGELVNAIIGNDTQGMAPNGHAWSQDAIWARLREMVAERFDVDPKLITPEAHFFKDLGLG